MDQKDKAFLWTIYFVEVKSYFPDLDNNPRCCTWHEVSSVHIVKFDCLTNEESLNVFFMDVNGGEKIQFKTLIELEV